MASCVADFEKALGSDHLDVQRVKAIKGKKGIPVAEVRHSFVTEELLPEAKRDLKALIDKVKLAYPNLITDEGRFVREAKPAEFVLTNEFQEVPEGFIAPPGIQVQFNQETGITSARLLPEEITDAPVRSKEKETKAGSEEPRPAEVLKKGKAKGPSAAPKGAAKPKTATTKGKTEAPKKAPKKKSKPARKDEPKQAEQKGPESVSSGVAAPAVAATTQDAQVAPIEASPEIVTIVDTIERSVGDEKSGAIAELLHEALVEGDIAALVSVNNEDLLWRGSDKELTIAAFIDNLQMLYSDSANTTFAHQQAMWDFAIQHDMLRDAYIGVTSGGDGIPGFTPTKPDTVMTAKLDNLSIAAVPISSNKEATDKLIQLLNKFIGFETDDSFAGHTVKALKGANEKIAIYIGEGADLSADFVPEIKISEMLKDGKIAWLVFEGSETLKSIAKPKKYVDRYSITSDMDARSKIFDSQSHKPITKPIPLGIAKSIVANMMNKFNVKVRPKHRVYKNLAELQRKDPKIYAEANASRRDGSSIPDMAAGYAFGNHILIFSDNIANKQQLTFTILHEVVGHFGLGSLMSTKNFRALMDDIYRADPAIRRDAEALKLIRSKAPANKLQKGKSIGHYEAIEEALADRAAELNNSIVQKVRNAIRKVLYAMGFRFHDDMTRFFIDQSLRYQRTGLTPDASAPAVYQHLKVLSERSLEGRASVPNTPEQQASNTTFHSAVAAKQKSVGLLGRSPGEPLGALIKRVANRKGAKAQVIGTWGDIKKALEHIQPMNNIAQFSEGIHRLYQAFVGQAQEVSHLKTKYITGTEYANRAKSKLFKFLGLQEGDAPSAADLEQASRALEMQNMAHQELSEKELKELPSLTKEDANGNKVLSYGLDENGEPVLDKNKKLQGIAAVKAVGAMTREEIDEGIEIPIMGNDGRPALKADGTLDTELFKLDKPLSDNAWRIIQEARTVIDQAALDAHINNINGILRHQDYIKGKMREDNGSLTPADLVIIDNILAVYRRFHDEGATLEGKGIKWLPESKDRATRWVHNTLRVLDTDKGVSERKLADWRGEYVAGTQDEKNMEEFRTSKDADIQLVLSEIKQLGANRENGGIKSGEIITTIKNIHALNANLTNSELYAKDSIAKAYVPFIRPGKYQVRVQAYNDKDNPIRLSDDLQAGLIYARHNNIADIERYVTALTDALSKSAPVDSILDSEGNTQDGVTFRGVWETALDAAPLAGNVDYGEIFSTLLRVGIDLNAVDREKLITLTAAQYSTARHNLQKKFVPGWNPDIHRGVREHLERQANIAAKNLYQHRISDTLVDDKIWFGDPAKHEGLQTAFVAALATKNEAKIFRAKRDMDRYQLQFEHAMPVKSDIMRMSPNKDGTHKEETVSGRGLGNHYRNKAVGMVSQYTAAHGMPAVTGDQKIGEVSGIFMTVGTAAHLGGAIAPAAINTTSLVTHAIPFLATYNPKTGFGLGHGLQAAGRAIFRAGSDLSLIKDGRLDATGSSKAIRAIIKKGPEALMARYGMTMDEAEMLYDHTDKGAMTANLTNVLTATNTFLKGTKSAKAVETWMFLFTKTEQFNRRVTGLAAYRLERDRMFDAFGLDAAARAEFHANLKYKDAKNLKAQITEEEHASMKRELDNRVDEAIDFSQGNYEKFNHPSLAQGPILKYLWVYKQFQAITIILMRHLGHGERAAFLAFFILTAGLKGIPFEEDFADLIDTLMQTFGINWNGLDAEMVSLFTSLGLPAGVMMRGPFDYYFGLTYSTRISQSNIIPGSGFLKAGADPWREAKDVIGPVWNAWAGIFGATGTIGQYALETVGLRDDVTSGRDVLRTGLGLSALRNYARGITYFIDGTITNDRGQVVSHDAGTMTALFQMVGFYPSTATRQYDVNRINSNVTAYSKQMIRGYVDAYVKADKAGKRNIRRQVREWNKNVGRRSPLYIRDFSGKISRAGKSARQSSVERSIKALPTGSKPFAKDIARQFGLSPKGLEIGR